MSVQLSKYKTFTFITLDPRFCKYYYYYCIRILLKTVADHLSAVIREKHSHILNQLMKYWFLFHCYSKTGHSLGTQGPIWPPANINHSFPSCQTKAKRNIGRQW